MTPILEVRNLSVHFTGGNSIISGKAQKAGCWAVNDVNLTIHRGETVGIVGETGCGKTTLALTMLGAYLPAKGEIFFDGEKVTQMRGKNLKVFRRRAQMVFQDPYQSLNPRFNVQEILSEPLRAHKIFGEEQQKRMVSMLNYVGLQPAEKYLLQYPNQLSGGQRQRIGIARALVLDPDFLIADEPVSMLDVSIRAGVLDIFEFVNKDRGTTLIHISHDLAVLRHTCCRLVVMFAGRIVEEGLTDDVIFRPSHPYTKALIVATASSIQDIDREVGGLMEKSGEVVSPATTGCPFRFRCSFAITECSIDIPPLIQTGERHWAACIRAVTYPFENNITEDTSNLFPVRIGGIPMDNI